MHPWNAQCPHRPRPFSDRISGQEREAAIYASSTSSALPESISSPASAIPLPMESAFSAAYPSKSIALIVGKMVDAIEEGITERKNNKDLIQEEEEEEVDEMKENNEEEENKDDRRQRGNRRPRRPVGKN